MLTQTGPIPPSEDPRIPAKTFFLWQIQKEQAKQPYKTKINYRLILFNYLI